MRELSADGPVVFYDGECGLCDRTIKFLIRVDRHKRLRYATLQGETAERVIGAPDGPSDAWAVKLLDSNGLFDRSDAALRAIAYAGGIWSVAKAFLLVPRFIRDGVYRWVATNRYRWFGKVDACMIPTPSLRERFLP